VANHKSAHANALPFSNAHKTLEAADYESNSSFVLHVMQKTPRPLIALVSNALPACGQEMQVPFCLPFDHLSTACARARTHTHTHTHMHAHAHIYTYTNLCLLVQACTAEASTACKSHAHTFCEGSMPMAWCE
jgi:hypothetical protein